ncbi:TPA: hypothetical protein ACSCYS_004305 [Aeromonas veronii]
MFKLQYPRFISPFWLNAHQINGVVLPDGTVNADGDVLHTQSGELPPAGTKVILLIKPTFLLGMTEEEAEAERESVKREQQLRSELSEIHAEQHRRAVIESIRSSNVRIKMPVRWTSGRKTVLSGLSERSDGSGLKKNSVCHILLLEPISESRFHRSANNFLCTTDSGSNGKDWTDGLHCHTDGPDGPMVSRITCSACLRIARRWASLNDAQNVIPEVI